MADAMKLSKCGQKCVLIYGKSERINQHVANVGQPFIESEQDPSWRFNNPLQRSPANLWHLRFSHASTTRLQKHKRITSNYNSTPVLALNRLEGRINGQKRFSRSHQINWGYFRSQNQNTCEQTAVESIKETLRP